MNDATQAEVLRLTAIIDRLLNHCDKENGECSECSRIICPHQEPLHFHHDGCPACSGDESAADSVPRGNEAGAPTAASAESDSVVSVEGQTDEGLWTHDGKPDSAETCRIYRGNKEKAFAGQNYIANAGSTWSAEQLCDAHNAAITRAKQQDTKCCLCDFPATSHCCPTNITTRFTPRVSVRKKAVVEDAQSLLEALKHYARRYDKDGKCWNWNNYVCDSYSGEVSHFDWNGDEQDDPWEIAERVLSEHGGSSTASGASLEKHYECRCCGNSYDSPEACLHTKDLIEVTSPSLSDVEEEKKADSGGGTGSERPTLNSTERLTYEDNSMLETRNHFWR